MINQGSFSKSYNWKRTFFIMKQFVFLICLFVTVCFIQYSCTFEKVNSIINTECSVCNTAKIDEVFVFIPQENRLYSSLFPADPDFIADLIWLKTAYYYGLVSSSNTGDFFFLPMMLDAITDLAPQWEFPYFFGGFSILFESGFINKGFQFIEKGMKNVPEMWELWLIKGMYLYKQEKNYQGAAEVIAQASLKKGAPKYLAPLSVTLALKSGEEDLVRGLVDIFKRSIEDERLLKRIIDKLHE